MSLLKKLQIGDNNSGRYTKEYLLTDYKCHTYRKHNEYRPDTDKYCDCIELTVIAPGREDVLMYDWFITQSLQNGRILIQLPPQMNQSEPESHEVLFEDACCFSLEEDYHLNKNQRRVLKLKLVAEEIVINDVTFYRR
jgi:hypothetical protein